MSVKDYYKTINIYNALTGECIEVIKTRLHESDTIIFMLEDIIRDDYKNSQDGILIKYGYEKRGE